METDMDYIGVIGNFNGNVIFCRFLSWFLVFEYLFERSDFKGSRGGILKRVFTLSPTKELTYVLVQKLHFLLKRTQIQSLQHVHGI